MLSYCNECRFIKRTGCFCSTVFCCSNKKIWNYRKRILDYERILARKKLTETEKELSEIIYEQTWENRNFWIIRSKWDKALFGKTTREMKENGI